MHALLYFSEAVEYHFNINKGKVYQISVKWQHICLSSSLSSITTLVYYVFDDKNKTCICCHDINSRESIVHQIKKIY